MSSDADSFESLKDLANLCYRCKKCAVVCPVAPSGQFNPRKFLFELNLEAPIREQLGVANAYDTDENIWWCLTCGKCDRVCPQEIKITDIVRQLRTAIRQQEGDNARFAVTETHKNIFPTSWELMLRSHAPPDKRQMLADYARDHDWIPLKVKEKGELAFYTGSLSLLEHALFGLEVPQTQSAYSAIRLLNMAGIEPVVANDYLSGHDAYWSGALGTFLAFQRRNMKIWKEAGIKTILVADAEDYRTLSVDYPQHVGPEDFPFEIVWLPDHVREHDLFEQVRERRIACYKRVTVHDPCRIGRMVGGGHYESIRAILNQVPHLELVEMPHNRDEASCCGVSAFRNCTDYSRELTQARIREAMGVGADFILTTCPKCISHFTCVIQNEFASLDLEGKANIPRAMDLFTFLGRVYHFNGQHDPL